MQIPHAERRIRDDRPEKDGRPFGFAQGKKAGGS